MDEMTQQNAALIEKAATASASMQEHARKVAAAIGAELPQDDSSGEVLPLAARSQQARIAIAGRARVGLPDEASCGPYPLCAAGLRRDFSSRFVLSKYAP